MTKSFETWEYEEVENHELYQIVAMLSAMPQIVGKYFS